MKHYLRGDTLNLEYSLFFSYGFHPMAAAPVDCLNTRLLAELFLQHFLVYICSTMSGYPSTVSGDHSTVSGDSYTVSGNGSTGSRDRSTVSGEGSAMSWDHPFYGVHLFAFKFPLLFTFTHEWWTWFSFSILLRGSTVACTGSTEACGASTKACGGALWCVGPEVCGCVCTGGTEE